MLGLRAIRSLRSALPKAQNTTVIQQATRSIASSSRICSEQPPALLGEGSTSGKVATDVQQATGLERLQLLGNLEGIDVFNTGPLLMSKIGTLKEPVMVPSYVSHSKITTKFMLLNYIHFSVPRTHCRLQRMARRESRHYLDHHRQPQGAPSLPRMWKW